MRWGFIGTGRIAERIMEAFLLLPRCEVVSAYSRNAIATKKFCERWSIPDQAASIEELVNNPRVDIIYLATPHIAHLEHFKQVITAKKPILCEKPMGMSEGETREMVSLAKEANSFLMEGLWTRFFPAYQWLNDIIASGKMGPVYNVMADFSYHSPYDPSLRFFRQDLGGGAMRGAGIYPLSLATMVFAQMPCELQAMADVRNNVDLRSAALLRFPKGGLAQIYSGFHGQSVQGANIAFEKGSIWIPDFWHPDKAVVRCDSNEQVIDFPYAFPGFQFEIEEVERCVQAGELQSSKMTWEESVGLAATLDKMYACWTRS